MTDTVFHYWIKPTKESNMITGCVSKVIQPAGIASQPITRHRNDHHNIPHQTT